MQTFSEENSPPLLFVWHLFDGKDKFRQGVFSGGVLNSCQRVPMAARQWGDCHFHAEAPEQNNTRYLGVWIENGEPGKEDYVFRVLYKL